MTINVNGQPKEAFNLILRREYAEQILAGSKTVEFRSDSDYYFDMFVDKEIAEHNKANGAVYGDDNWEFWFKDVRYIHFHNYNNTWFLDVAIKEIGQFMLDSEDVEYYAEDYPDFAELLAQAQANDKLPIEARPMMYFLAIDKVIDTNLPR